MNEHWTNSQTGEAFKENENAFEHEENDVFAWNCS